MLSAFQTTARIVWGGFRARPATAAFRRRRTAGFLGIGRRDVIDQARYNTRNIVNIGEVAPHLAVVEELDRRVFNDGFGKQEISHVGPAPRPVNGEKSQTCDRQTIEMAI